MSERVNERTETVRSAHGWMNGWRQWDWWRDAWMDGWMGGWMNGWMDVGMMFRRTIGL